MRILYLNRLGIELPLLFSMMILNHFPRKKIPLKYCTLFFVVAWLLLFAFILTGCKAQETVHLYKVIDSGIWTYPAGVEKTLWLDNERVLFVSNKTLSPGPGPKLLTIWNIKTGQIAFSHQLTSLICAEDGQVFFAVQDKLTGKAKHYRGPLENPQEYPRSSPDMRIDDCFNCDWVPKATWGIMPKPSPPHRRKLRGENYLEAVEPQGQIYSGRTLYYEKPGSQGKEVPFLPSYYISYSRCLDAYVVDRGMYDPAKPDTSAFWILERNGNLKKVPYPKTMLKGVLTIYPLKQGYLAHYNSGKYTITDPGDRGLWLLDGDKALRLIVGAIYGISVSPDGCRVAFIHARNIKEDLSQTKPYRTVKIINFCERGKD